MATPLYLLTPSFFSLFINGIVLLILSFVVIFNFRSFVKTEYIKLLPILGIISIAFGIHGTLHLGLEQAYNFNPLYMFFS